MIMKQRIVAPTARITTVGHCTRQRTPASTERTRRGRQIRRTAPRLFEPCGNTRRTSTTAAPPRSPTSSRITTGCVVSVSQRSSSETSSSI